MNEFNELNNNKYAYLRCLSMEELLDLLTIAPIPAVSPEKQAYVDALKEAIIEKENENPTGFFPDIDQQWEQFVTHYLPDVTEAAIEPECMEHAVSAQTNQQFPEVPSKHIARFSRLWRTALVAAAAVVCVLGIMLTAQAAGIDVFGSIARWTEDVFSFGQIPSDSVATGNLGGDEGDAGTDIPDVERKYSSLQEALDAHGMVEIHEPFYLPDGYAVNEIGVTYSDDPSTESYYAVYTYDDNYIQIDIIRSDDEPTIQVEKTDASVETIEQSGITFYLIENVKSHTIAWFSKGYEYYISGKLDKDTLWEMAVSMFQ